MHEFTLIAHVEGDDGVTMMMTIGFDDMDEVPSLVNGLTQTEIPWRLITLCSAADFALLMEDAEYVGDQLVPYGDGQAGLYTQQFDDPN